MVARIRVIRAAELTTDLISRWRWLQRSNPQLASPYFAPEYTQIVASFLPNVDVGLVESGGEIACIFPFQGKGYRTAGPVGGIISDCQGLVCQPGFACEPRELLRGCGLVAWDFNHLIGTQAFFRRFLWHESRSPLMDLSNGFERYARERRDAGSEQIKKCRNLARRLEREVGPLRFVNHSPEVEILDRLVSWKSEQLRRLHRANPFARPWVGEVVRRIHATRSGDFGGELSALFAGERLVAAHFGMRSSSILHYWFPAYDPDYARYSPGIILLLKMAESAAASGVKVIDLGRGEQEYKLRLMNDAVPLIEGSVECASLVTACRRITRPLTRARWRLQNRLVKTPLVKPVRWLRDSLRRLSEPTQPETVPPQ